MSDDMEIREMIMHLRAGLRAATAGELCYVKSHGDMVRLDGDLNLYAFATTMIASTRRAASLSDLAATDAEVLTLPKEVEMSEDAHVASEIARLTSELNAAIYRASESGLIVCIDNEHQQQIGRAYSRPAIVSSVLKRIA